MDGVDGTSINTNPPIYTCEVGTRREDGIKSKKKKNTRMARMKFVTKLKNNI